MLSILFAAAQGGQVMFADFSGSQHNRCSKAQQRLTLRSSQGMSQQDPSYRAEYEAYSARRAAEVSYRNYLRQWRRSDEGHTARGEPPIEKGVKGGKGGVTPPPPPPKRRQELTEGGDAPPAVKAKGGETPLETAGASPAQQQAQDCQARKASKVLEEAGYPEFPDYVPSCGGSIADINQGRLTVAATKKLIDGLSPCTGPNTDIANALMSSFLRTRRGLAGEDLLPKLGSAVAFPGNWFKLEYSAPNRLNAGRLLPSDPGIPGRNGVYLHKPINRHLAENYSSLTRYGARHIFVKPCMEVVYDIRGSLKAGKQTNQVIQAFDSVQIVAIHLRIATQQSLQASEYLMEWSGSLELPLHAARSAFEALGLGDRLSVPAASMALLGGETPLGEVKSGETPSSSSEFVTHGPSVNSEGTVGGRGNLATVDEAPPEMMEWLGEEGSLGSFRGAAKNPESALAFSISKGLAACLRHNHKPRIHVNRAGWAKLSEVLRWPRIAETSASAGDILEVVRSNQKQRYQLGLQNDGPYFIRAIQGHSRTEVGEENLLEPVSEEQLPDTLLHGTSWNAYESIQQRGLLPGRTQTTSSKGGRKGGKWREGRQHVHFFSDAGGVSGQREGSTMLVRISTRKASEQGVRFLISRNGVYLTPDEVPPICSTSFQSLRTGDLYDRDGERIQSSG
ncbi:putative RNA 2'-phosphotransferase [Symbiodinium microadriaticum]|uniref:2'-phosphotransferase n=1 Tax=Symbiodinium microadriaticum TaxID=2951 RepID=A0A1Q9CEE4_SYMMI|nr:putative RNA 2'-phosphotransferase [Symbiodinium microadriaticum]